MSSIDTNIAIVIARVDHSDAELVRRAVEGDRWAEESLYRTHVNAVSSFCLRLLRSRADMEDVVQDTFVQAFDVLHTLREPEKFKPWIMRIAFYRMQHLFRRRCRTFRIFTRTSIHDVPLEEQAVSTATQEQRTELALLDAALDKMTDEERFCWVLRYLERYRIKEIIQITGMSKTTIKRRIASAQDTVNDHFGENIHG